MLQRAPAAKVYLSTAAGVLAVATGVTARPLFASFGLVHGESTTSVFFSIKGGHGGITFGRSRHRDESEAAGLAGHFISDQSHFFDLTVLLEKILKIVLGCLEGKVSYLQFHVI